MTELSGSEHRELVGIIRDALAGELRVKASSERYLPKPEGMSAAGYQAMKARASFLNAPRAVLDGLTGRIFRKPAEFKLAGLEDRLPWWNGSYQSWDALSRTITREVLSVGRVAVLVDPSPRQFEAHVTVFGEEAIETTVIDATGQLAEVVLKQQDGSKLTLWLEEGVYTAKIDDGDPVVPVLAGKTLDYLPITFITPRGVSVEREQPPLTDLCLKALTHYQLYAEYRQALHYVATPQPFVSGFQPSEVPTVIGPTTIWKAANPSAKAQFVSFSGNGLEELRVACELLKVEMAALGASMLVAREASNVAAKTVELRQREDTSLVISAVHAVNEGLANIARQMLEWERGSGDVTVRLNMDLTDTMLDAALLKALRDCYLSGAISWESFVDVLRRGEIIPAERSAEDERSLIETDGRVLGVRNDHAGHALP